MSFGQIDYAANRAWQQRTAKPLARSDKELKRTPIRKRSKKLQADMKVYVPIMVAFLKHNPVCWCCIEKEEPNPRPATAVHHVCGREGFYLAFVPLFMPVCEWCHILAPDSIENNNTEAEARGWKISRHLSLEEQLERLKQLRGHFEHVQRELKLWEEGQ